MRWDKHTNSRRWFLRAAVALGALSAGRAVFGPDHGAPAAGTAQRGRGRPSGPDTAVPSHPDAMRRTEAYRLRPMAGETSRSGPGASPPHPEVAHVLSTARQEIFLTFDDGPHPHYTPEILRVLRRHGARATFFVVGERALAFPRLLRDIADDGHAVGNHTWSHLQLTTLPPGAVRGELGRTSSLIDDVLGAAPDLARAPYGAWDAPSLSICNELGMSPVGWAVDSADWTTPGARNIADTVVQQIRPGAIVLSHDGGGWRGQTVEALDRYLPRLLDEGYRPNRIEP
ncbi:polysaccharide deacetylase family protein [Streptomyces sp. NPDC020742]|uniref:polysaccharide deacetylase family protein n=1 Tax=Streptomyces sp. NPDC020742 TaxID=3154897 RepID=UPI0033F89D3B